MAEKRKLGIIAGNGTLPNAVIKACRQEKRPVFVLGLKGHADPALLQENEGAFIRLGSVGRAIRLFRRAGVQDIVFIGGVRRPSVAEILPDFKGLCMLVKVGFRLLGDNQLLSILLAEAEHQGFTVMGVDQLVPGLVAPEGVYGNVAPSIKDWEDIRHGVQVAKILGQADVGQAVIVQRGLVLSVEGIEGTTELIRRTAALKRKGAGGVLVKVAKPQQDRRVDLPTIGPQTVQAICDAGFKGIAIEAGSALLAGADQTIALADKLGVFIVGVRE